LAGIKGSNPPYSPLEERGREITLEVSLFQGRSGEAERDLEKRRGFKISSFNEIYLSGRSE